MGMTRPLDFGGRVVLVTGASGGIGAAVAKGLANVGRARQGQSSAGTRR